MNRIWPGHIPQIVISSEREKLIECRGEETLGLMKERIKKLFDNQDYCHMLKNCRVVEEFFIFYSNERVIVEVIKRK